MMEYPVDRTSWYLNTSAEDCRISLQNCTAAKLPLLRECLTLAEANKQKTHIMHISRRIKQLEKEIK